MTINTERKVRYVMYALTHRKRDWRHAWLMGAACYNYTRNSVGPDERQIGFWYSLNAGIQLFIGNAPWPWKRKT